MSADRGPVNFSGVVSWRKQQERPDGSLWSVTVWVDNFVQVKETFGSEPEADAYVQSLRENRP